MVDNKKIFENTIGFIDGDDWIYCELQSRRYINKIKKLQEKHPDDIVIISESIDGGLSVRLNTERFKFNTPTAKRNMSDEFKQQASERFKKMWEDKTI